MNGLDQRLLNDFQNNFPLCPTPYREMATALGTRVDTVLATLHRLQARRVVSRVGPVFRPHVIGVSTLATMAVPNGRLTKVAMLVNGYREVNHNYEREHHFNLWFVLNAADERRLSAVIAEIERKTQLAVLSLPMLEAYHIDLGFRMDLAPSLRDPHTRRQMGTDRNSEASRSDCVSRRRKLSVGDLALVREIQDGIPLVRRPYAAIASLVGMTEDDVIHRIDNWLERGVIKRFGIVVRHHELGYNANAMVVWNIEDDAVSALGKRMAGFDFVTLCYRRARDLPDWPYNLYCMIHGRTRERVRSQLEMLRTRLGLDADPYELLFSVRRFKQRGARYAIPQRRIASAAA